MIYTIIAESRCEFGVCFYIAGIFANRLGDEVAATQI